MSKLMAFLVALENLLCRLSRVVLSTLRFRDYSRLPMPSSAPIAHNFPDKTSRTVLLICEVHLFEWIEMPCPPALLQLVRAGMGKGSTRKGSWQETKNRFSLTVLLLSILPQLQHCHLARAEMGQQGPPFPMRNGALSSACFPWYLPTPWVCSFILWAPHTPVSSSALSPVSPKDCLSPCLNRSALRAAPSPLVANSFCPGCSWVMAATGIQCSQRSNWSVHSSSLHWAKDLDTQYSQFQ